MVAELPKRKGVNPIFVGFLLKLATVERVVNGLDYTDLSSATVPYENKGFFMHRRHRLTGALDVRSIPAIIPAMYLAITKPAAQEFLIQELEILHQQKGQVISPTLVSLATDKPITNLQPCFASAVLLDPVLIQADSLNQLTQKIAEYFLTGIKNRTIDQPWFRRFMVAAETPGLSGRAKTVERSCQRLFERRTSRVARLACVDAPAPDAIAFGLWVYFVEFNQVWVAMECWWGGQQRMRDDADAPSRSYLKIEEAYQVLGLAPQPGQTVVDLGAAPGGWSYSAAQRKAKVCAVDNGPLKGRAKDHPGIKHDRQDAFKFALPAGKMVDWLLADMVEDPYLVLGLLERWVSRKLCRHFIVNFKIGQCHAAKFLKTVRQQAWLKPPSCVCKVRQLYHDRDEITLMGRIVHGK